MFDRIVSKLENPAGGFEYSSEDVQSAVAALYYHMIAVDGVVRFAELERLQRVLKKQFNLNDEQVHDLMKRGRSSDSESPGLFPFTVVLNRQMDVEKRRDVLKHLTSLARADGHKHPLEIDLLDNIGELLKV